MKIKTLRQCLLLVIFTLMSGLSIAQKVVEVEIKNYQFHPAQLTIKQGTTVRWINNEKRQYHSVWFEESGEPEAEYFFPDENDERTFNETGTFNYRCGPHEKMRGTITVTE